MKLTSCRGEHEVKVDEDLLCPPVFNPQLFFSQSHSHTVNLLSALPLQCLDVLLIVPPAPDSQQCQGVNMDCVHVLLMFLEKRLDSVICGFVPKTYI